MAHRVYVGIGSNLGDRRANAREAMERIGRLPDTRVVGASALYESEPLGSETTWFVNAVIAVDTALAPQDLLDRLLAIEVAMGRVRVAGERWGPRTIDLDILLVDGEVIDTPTLTVPHPAMHERRFVLMPLAEIAPDAIHPRLGQSVATLLATVEDDKRVAPLGPD